MTRLPARLTIAATLTLAALSLTAAAVIAHVCELLDREEPGDPADVGMPLSEDDRLWLAAAGAEWGMG